MLHSPDGGVLWVESSVVSVLQEAARHQDHIAKGTKSIIYLPAARPFGVRETAKDVRRMMEGCK